MTGSNRRATRKPGLQHRWGYVVDSLERIRPVYERGSTRIALFGDSEMRRQVVRFAVRESTMVLDLGSGPGTMGEIIMEAKCRPISLDVSRRMLQSCSGTEKVQAVFENLPFRDGTFDSVVAGFSLRDARDLVSAIKQVRYVLNEQGRFAFCDLGKPDSAASGLAIAFYLRAVVPLIGLVTGGRKGLAFGSLYQTYVLALKNSQLVSLLRHFFAEVHMDARQAGAAIVVGCMV